LAIAILSLKNVFEDYIGLLAQDVAINSGASCLLARKTRRVLDANRVPNSRKIKIKNRLEFGHGLYLAEYLFLQKIFKETLGQEEAGEVEKPFLHISLHGKSNKPDDVGDVIVSNALRHGKMPCDPQIARWFSGELNRKIKEKGVKKKDGSYYTSGVAIEGERFCGNVVQSDRRYGRDDFKGISLGENYQYVQVELSPFIRQNYLPELQNIIGEILTDFKKNFSTANQLDEFLKKNQTVEDEHRLNSEMYLNIKQVNDDEIRSGEILLSKNYRDALSVEIGDSILVDGVEYLVVGADKEKFGLLQPVVKSDVNISTEKNVIKTK